MILVGRILPFVIVLAAATLALAIAYNGRFQMEAVQNSPAVWRIDRWTGRLSLCVTTQDGQITCRKESPPAG